MDGQPRNTLPKKERLCGKTSIATLLAKGRHGNVPGLRFCCLTDNGTGRNRLMVSVPKKLFKRAVKRNMLKRRIRESYRKLKHALPEDKGMDLLITYSTKEILPYEDICNAVSQVIGRVSKMAENKMDEKKSGHDEDNVQ